MKHINTKHLAIYATIAMLSFASSAFAQTSRSMSGSAGVSAGGRMQINQNNGGIERGIKEMRNAKLSATTSVQIQMGLKDGQPRDMKIASGTASTTRDSMRPEGDKMMRASTTPSDGSALSDGTKIMRKIVVISATIERLQNIDKKLDSKIAELKAGASINASSTSMASSTTKTAEAERLSAEAKTYLKLAVDGLKSVELSLSTSQTASTTPDSAVKSQMENIKSELDLAQQNMEDAVKSLKSGGKGGGMKVEVKAKIKKN